MCIFVGKCGIGASGSEVVCVKVYNAEFSVYFFRATVQGSASCRSMFDPAWLQSHFFRFEKVV